MYLPRCIVTFPSCAWAQAGESAPGRRRCRRQSPSAGASFLPAAVMTPIAAPRLTCRLTSLRLAPAEIVIARKGFVVFGAISFSLQADFARASRRTGARVSGNSSSGDRRAKTTRRKRRAPPGGPQVPRLILQQRTMPYGLRRGDREA